MSVKVETVVLPCTGTETLWYPAKACGEAAKCSERNHRGGRKDDRLNSDWRELDCLRFYSVPEDNSMAKNAMSDMVDH